ncbi:uncharacterized protein NEMAJ01_1936 [Nematocida major]|uniref:uncharacterized protein n=1 Tax=Nematocida major TaxID=1912982 RepID=UPI00200843A1|nr:uncharacterized protein NEMAJ01_1936 [Nematocida major]KAH9387040.1 hypothetical protein NEMAJ01_1936 [Nematocida major]
MPMEFSTLEENASILPETGHIAGEKSAPFKGSVKERLSCGLLGIILCFMDTLTIGTIGLGSCPDIDLPKYSEIFFVMGLLASQLTFYIFSSFRIGIVTTPISENFVAFGEVSGLLYTEGGLRGAQFFWTLMAFISLSTILTGFVFFALYVTGFQKILAKVPKQIGVSLFFVIGVFCCIYGNESILGLTKNGKNIYTREGIILAYNFVGAGLWCAARYASKKYPSFGPFSYSAVLALAVALSYIPIFLVWGGIDQARHANILPTQTKSFFTLFDLPLIKELSPSAIAWEWIFSVKILLRMLGVIAINLVQFPINVSAISTACKTEAHIKKELLANGVSNVASSVVGGFPTYVVSSSTIAFNRNKSITARKDGLLMAVAFAVLYILGQSVFSYIPQICLDCLLLFIGLDIIYDSGMDIWGMGSYTILFSVCVVVPAICLKNIPVGMGIGMLISIARHLYRKYHASRTQV